MRLIQNAPQWNCLHGRPAASACILALRTAPTNRLARSQRFRLAQVLRLGCEAHHHAPAKLTGSKLVLFPCCRTVAFQQRLQPLPAPHPDHGVTAVKPAYKPLTVAPRALARVKLHPLDEPRPQCGQASTSHPHTPTDAMLVSQVFTVLFTGNIN